MTRPCSRTATASSSSTSWEAAANGIYQRTAGALLPPHHLERGGREGPEEAPERKSSRDWRGWPRRLFKSFSYLPKHSVDGYSQLMNRFNVAFEVKVNLFYEDKKMEKFTKLIEHLKKYPILEITSAD